MMTQQGYAANGEMIVLFAKNSVIRDGQHRAAILAAQYGLDHVIPVVVIDFHGRSWGYDRLRRIPRRYARALIHLGRRFARRLLWYTVGGRLSRIERAVDELKGLTFAIVVPPPAAIRK
jgi:hypothetical protein